MPISSLKTSSLGMVINMRQLRVGIDLDGVVVDSPQQVVHYVNERLGTSYCMNDFKTYSMEDALPDKDKWIIEAAFRDPLMWKKVSLIDGAYENIKKLFNSNFDIYFATSSLPQNLKKKIGHLTRNLSFLPENYVWRHTINIHNKQLLNLDVHVDDGLFNLVGERSYYSICFDMPYNQTDEIIPNFSRAKDWNEVYDRIKMVESLIKENVNE